MKIVFGADDDSATVHAVRDYLSRNSIEYDEPAAGSWVEIAQKVAEAVVSGKADYGILLCWTGSGVAIAANKINGIRAATAWEPWIAEHARLWNDANVLTMSLKRTAPDVAVEIVEAFLSVQEPDQDELPNIEAIEK